MDFSLLIALGPSYNSKHSEIYDRLDQVLFFFYYSLKIL